MSNYYSLEDAAAKLNMSVDALRELAKKREIRSFQDRGTLRFKSEDIEARLNQPSTTEEPREFELELDLPGTEPTPEQPLAANQEETPLNLDLDLGLDSFTLPTDHETPNQAPATNDPSTSSGEVLGIQGDASDSGALSFDLQSDSSSDSDSSSMIEPPKESPFELSEPVIDLGSDTIGLVSDSDSDSSSSLNQPTMGEISVENAEVSLDDSMISSQSPSSSIEVNAAQISEDSSEFELSIDDSGSMMSADSQIEPGSGTELSDDSGSEFELTLDDGVDNSSEIQLSEGSDLESSDFELEASESDSGSQIVEVEGGGDADMMEQTAEFASADELEVVEDSSSSQVVAVDEVGDIEEAVEEVSEEIVEEEETLSPVTATAAETPWGILPALVLIPGVIILSIVSLMSFELMRGLYGYNKGTGFTSVILKPIAEMFTELPK
ncbi:MAG: helix-turn-helix domain-containing protein [Gemmataceae bacterium]|jgi:hypothetical protein